MSARKKGDSVWGFVVGFAILICVGGYYVWNHWFNHEGAYTDYASAGAHVLEQINEHDEKVYVRFNTDSYNRFLGADEYIKEIFTVAYAHTGDPRRGDHLAINTWPAKTEGIVVDMPDKTKNLNMNVDMKYNMTLEQEEELNKDADRILAGLRLDGKSDYKKARAIYAYICSHVVYDYDHVDDTDNRICRSAYGAAVKGAAVCAGIADLFYYLANSAGLDARIEINREHAWNFVRIDGKYYYIDATWDLGKSEADWQYFLKGITDFEEHRSVIMLDEVGKTLIRSHENYDIASKAYQPSA